MLTKWMYLLSLIYLISCASEGVQPTNPSSDPPVSDAELSYLNIPDGFAVQVFAKNVKNARQMELSPDGTLFVGSRKDHVTALKDIDNDGRVDTSYVIAQGLEMPNGVAYKDGDLYVAEVSRIIRFNNVEKNLKNNMDYEVIYDGYPDRTHHGWKFIAFGPDEKLYVPVGAPCNICLSEDPIFNTITRLDVETKKVEIVHEGIRNTVGFTWHPENDKLWFTDNGGDNLGDDIPGDELNFAYEDGGHYGYPYCHQGDYPDPTYGEDRSCDEFNAPTQILGPHVAALGAEFNLSSTFPDALKNRLFIAEHGSWNRTDPIGYRITTVETTPDGKASNYKVWLDGFRDSETGDIHGRPVDMEWMPDGSLLISDDYGDQIFRVIAINE